MAYPDLYSDESIVLKAQNIKVKSVSFEAVLTTRRLILVDSKKHLIAPQEILLATVRDIEPGENAIRDSTITLSIITPTGATRQMILTFSKVSGGERKRESDEWVKALKQMIASGVRHPIMPDPQYPPESYQDAADMYPSSVHVEAVNVPPMPTQKRKIEVARPGPIKKIVDTTPQMPVPVETSTMPTGSFCNRCGSRVPPESAFCNKCGTPVVTDSEIEAHLATANEPAAPQVPQVQVHTPPAYGTYNKERPIEEVIHSIEPLIEDSVPRTTVAPVIPSPYASHTHETLQTPVADPADDAPAPETPATTGVSWPVIGSSTEPAPATEASPSSEPPMPPAPALPPAIPSAPARSKKPIIIGALVLVVLIVIGAVFILPMLTGGGTTPQTPVEVITPSTTVPPTTHVTPAKTIMPVTTAATTETSGETPVTVTTTSSVSSIVPASGVWVRVVYTDLFKGTVGTAGDQMAVADTGEKLYQIPTSEGVVAVNLQKMDGTGDKLLVEVYKDGTKVAEKSTSVPKGVVDLLVNLKPAATPTPTPTPTKVPIPVKTTAIANSTVNATTNASVTTST